MFISESFNRLTVSDEKYLLKYLGEDKVANTDYHDGQMRPAVGTHNYQILRANRSYPELSDGVGWTYNHAPTLAYWNGYFICQYLSNPSKERLMALSAMISAVWKQGEQ